MRRNSWRSREKRSLRRTYPAGSVNFRKPETVAPVGSVGDDRDNAFAETAIGLSKTEVVKHLGPRKTIGQVEWETTKWVHWYNNHRLHGPSAAEWPTRGRLA